MAILKFELDEGELTAFSDCGSMLCYRVLGDGGLGWTHADFCHRRILGIRDICAEEAAGLRRFLKASNFLKHFRSRMATVDWNVLQGRPGAV